MEFRVVNLLPTMDSKIFGYVPELYFRYALIVTANVHKMNVKSISLL